METKITSQTETEVQFTVTLNELQLKQAKAETFDKLRSQVKAAGFRTGKAPDAIVERELGSSAVQGEWIEHAIQQSYAEVVREQKFPVVAPPQITVEKIVPYTEIQYKVVVEIMPKVKLADYRKFRLKRPSVKVEASEIERTIEDLRRRQATRIDSEQPAKSGDEVNFDFEGTKDGQAVPGATAQGHTLRLGSNTFIPGFEDALVGLKKGDEKSFEIRFPKDYHEKSLADQIVTFKVNINTVTELVLPTVDEEFVQAVSPFKTLDELKEDITKRITDEKAEQTSRQYEQSILDKLLKESALKLPNALVQQQLQRLHTELQEKLAYSGLDLEKYLDLSNKTREQLDAELMPEAERRVSLAMTLTEVAAQENLTVSKSDLDDEVSRLKQSYPDPATQAELDNPATREEIYNHLMASKVIACLIDYAEAK